jgi:dihydrofolate reductase
MNISIIVAASLNHVIGVKNKLPWRLSADLKYFKQLTTGHTIVMGRKTFDSIGKALPNRENIVVTKNSSFRHEGIIVKHSIDEAFNYCKNHNDVFIIGGDTIYQQTIAFANTIYLTKVHTMIDDGDAFFEELNSNEWSLIKSESHKRDEKNEFDFTFEVYQRNQK